MAGVIAVGVFAMLRELDGEAAIRGFVFARHVAFDNVAGVETERLCARDRKGIQKLIEGFLIHEQLKI